MVTGTSVYYIGTQSPASPLQLSYPAPSCNGCYLLFQPWHALSHLFAFFISYSYDWNAFPSLLYLVNS